MTAPRPISARATEMVAAGRRVSVDNLQVVAQDTGGNLHTVDLGDLCIVCAGRPRAGEDCLCAECRSS